jgi:hypothetical protein
LYSVLFSRLLVFVHAVFLFAAGLLVFGEWYDEETLNKLRFYDDNTRSWWEAATGGAARAGSAPKRLACWKGTSFF